MISLPSSVNHFRHLLLSDPGLPRTNGSDPYWLSVKHKLAEIQSPSLPPVTDVAIIGSGITGTSVAYNLLHTPQSDVKVTVLEARTLCSGATGRNGGNLLSYGPVLYSSLKKAAGQEMALKVLDFLEQTVVATREVVERHAQVESQLRAVTRIHAWTDADAFEKVKQGLLEFYELRPKSKDTHVIIDGEQAMRDHGLHGVVGAIKYPANALWPYRFITKVWEALLEQFPSRLSVEANTPVTQVRLEPESSNSHPYLINTSRGIIRARHVVYCTNGYTGHLLPKTRGLIWPCRETVTVRDLGKYTTDIRGDKESWSIVQRDAVDEEAGTMESSLLYLQQNAESGYWFIGGGLNSLEQTLSADDSDPDWRSANYLDGRLRDFLGAHNAEDKAVSSWSGVQGMTSDSAPLVGRVPEALSGRKGKGEWIAAGYNGGGMCICWLAGKALANMMLQDEAVPEWFPESFLLTEQRLQLSLSVDAAMERADSYPPGRY